MGHRINVVVMLVVLALPLRAQLSPALIAGLESTDWLDRQRVFESLVGRYAERTDEVRGPEVNRVLVELLYKENAIVRAAYLEGPGSSTKYGEGYSEYTSWVATAVEKIADKEPDIPGIWLGLLMHPYNPESAFTRWLVTHGDRIAPFLLAAVKGNDPYFRRGDTLIVLAQLVAYERAPNTVHRLNPRDIDEIASVVRAGVHDKVAVVRYQAIDALGLMGTADDLATLERIATLDPEFVTDGGMSGKELRYPNRENARRVAEILRKRLGAGKHE